MGKHNVKTPDLSAGSIKFGMSDIAETWLGILSKPNISNDAT
jgi:hypothetical protein